MHPPISNITCYLHPLSDFFTWIRWFQGLSMFGASGIAFCLKTFCPFWCCLQLSMPHAPTTLFPFSHMTFKPVMDSFGWKHLYPTPPSHSCLCPHFSCAQRHLIFRSLFLLPYAFRCGPAGSLFLGELATDILPSYLLQPLPGIYFVFIPIKQQCAISGAS